MEPAIVDIGVRQNHVAVRHGRCSMESWAQLENRGEIPFLPRQVSLARRALEAGVRLDARSRARWEKKKNCAAFSLLAIQVHAKRARNLPSAAIHSISGVDHLRRRVPHVPSLPFHAHTPASLLSSYALIGNRWRKDTIASSSSNEV